MEGEEPTTEEEIFKAEDKLGKLHEDYKTFLLAFNGGWPKTGSFDYQGERFNIICILSVNNEDCDLLEFNMDVREEEDFPADRVVIALTDEASMILLNKEGDTFLFKDENEDDENEDEEAYICHPVGKFSGFIERLFDSEEQENRLI